MRTETYLKMSSVASVITSIAVVAFVLRGSNYIDSTLSNRTVWHKNEQAQKVFRCRVARELEISSVEEDRCGRIDP